METGGVLYRRCLSASIITSGGVLAFAVACLFSLDLPFHLNKALENGVSREDLIEAITHLAFYPGWPTASSAVAIA